MAYPSNVDTTVNEWAKSIPLGDKAKINPSLDQDPTKVPILRLFTTNIEHTEPVPKAILGNKQKLSATNPHVSHDYI